jgi:hypothetical protein
MCLKNFLIYLNKLMCLLKKSKEIIIEMNKKRNEKIKKDNKSNKNKK